MCSIATNSTADETLTELVRSNDKKKIQKRLYNFANDANVEKSGALDTRDKMLSGMPEKLKDIRKLRIGRHRIFYTGFHTQCSYRVFYIKKFKKTGVEDENDPKFHRILISSLEDDSSTVISNPKKNKKTKKSK